jgi:outer membrane receptor protein involved in Fe transport
MSEFYRSGGFRHRVLRAFSKRTALKAILLSGASLTLAAGLAGPAYAQAKAQAEAASPETEEVVVTGTQVLRNGYSAPTPLRVVGVDDINANAPTNLSDYLVKLPALAGSTGPRSSGNSVSDGNGGVAGLNIRKLGNNRTLVLLDGMRIGPSSESGASTAGEVDINEFPDALIKRIDIVTGGASAQYGSDALAGVVNFILDKDFTGVKGSLQGGMTSYADDRQVSGSLTAGFGFLNGRGHVLLSGSVSHTDGILHGSARSWVTDNAYDMITTPGYTTTNGLPYYTVAKHVGSGLYTPGGLIGNTALMGTDFGPGSVPRNFNYGALTTGNGFMIGGDYKETYPALTDSGEQYTTSLDDQLDRQNFFGRVSYDVTDHFQVFADVLYSNAQVLSYCCTSGQLLTIKNDNPFIPATVKARMTALNITSFSLGQLNTDIGATGPANTRQKTYFAGGASGDFDLLGSNWQWNAYGSASRAVVDDRAINSPVVATFQQATDAVTDPKTGYAVCRSTLTTPGNGCVPYNPMGVGVNSPTAIAYALGGVSQMHTEIGQETFGGVLRGNPFDLWAGTVSVSTGIEHRQESVTGVSSPTDMANGFFLGNYHPAIGGVTVNEGFVEAVVPLAHDYSWAKELDMDVAIRETGYSASGNVMTYKVGLVYDAPGFLEGFRLRATRSRDIRAPSLGDLYSGGRVGQGTIIDTSVTPNKSVPNVLSPTLGNPNLKPEVANQTGVGAVYSPAWIPGLNMSVDLFQVQMHNVISSLSSQNVVIACYKGVTAYCPFIQRDATGTISIVTSTAANTAYLKEAGLDLEASYTMDLADFGDPWSGNVTLHALATNIWQQTGIDPLGNITTSAGSNSGGVPHWSYNFSATYDAGDYALTWVGRGIGSGVRSRQYTQCTSACPNLTAPLYTINDNYMPGAFYMDLNLTYRLKAESLGSPELFFNVENLTNNNPDSFFVGNSNPLYDRLGTNFRAGFRFKL